MSDAAPEHESQVVLQLTTQMAMLKPIDSTLLFYLLPLDAMNILHTKHFA